MESDIVVTRPRRDTQEVLDDIDAVLAEVRADG